MSRYTTQLRYICEVESGLSESVGGKQVASVIEGARGKIFDFHYPIFDEAYRPVLETKILKHYYTREVCAETYGLWKLWLDAKMNEIMPYYNQMYKSELLEFNPLYDVDLSREHSVTREENKEETEQLIGKTIGKTERDGGGKVNESVDNTESTTNEVDVSDTFNGRVVNSGSGSGNGNSTDAYSDTPQGGLDNLKSYTYLTNARDIVSNNSYENEDTETTTNTRTGKNSSENNVTGNSERETTNEFEENVDNTIDITNTTTGNTNLNNIEEYLEHVSGKTSGKSYSKMLNEYRTTFLNIDMLVIDELSDLFFNLW